MQLVAGRYDVLCEPKTAESARDLLAKLGYLTFSLGLPIDVISVTLCTRGRGNAHFPVTVLPDKEIGPFSGKSADVWCVGQP